MANRLEVILSGQVGELKQAFQDASRAVDKTTADIAKSNAEISKSVAAIGSEFEKSAASVAGISKKMGASFENVAASAAGVAAGMLTAQAAVAAVGGAFSLAEKAVQATFGALSDAVTHTADLGDELLALSQKTGLSVESLSAFKFVAGQTNTSLDSITGAVFKLEQNLGSGAKATSAALNGIGLSLQNLKQQDPADAFASIIAKLGEIPNASDRAAAGVAIFGKSFKDISQLTQENLPALIAQAKELGVVMSTEAAIAADRYNDALGALNATAEGVKIAIGSKLLPAVIAFSEAFGAAFLEASKQSGVSAEQFGKSIDQAVQHTAEAAGRFISIFATITDAVVTWSVKSVLSMAAAIEAQASLADKVISIGRTIDQATTGGALSGAFDRMEASVKAAHTTVDEIVGPLVTAGSAFHTLATNVEAAGKAAGSTFTDALKKVKDDIDKSAQEMRERLKAQLQAAHQETGAGAKAIASDLKFVADAIDRTDDAVQRFDTAQMQRELQDLAREARGVIDEIEDVNRRVQQFARSQDDAADQMKRTLAALNTPLSLGSIGFGTGFGFTQGQMNSFGLFGQQASEKATAPFRAAFAKLGQDLPQLLQRGLEQGGTAGAIAAVAGAASGGFAAIFQEGMKDIADGKQVELTGKQLGAGIAAAALQSFSTGFTTGLQSPGAAGLTSSVLSGLLGGLATGNPYVALAGGASAVVGNLVGADQNKEQQQQQIAVATQKLLTQYHGMQKLADLLGRADFRGRRGNQTPAEFLAGFANLTSVDQFNGAIADMNASLDTYNEKLKAIASSTDAVNRRTVNFGKQFEPLVAARTSAKESGDTGAAAIAGQQIQELAQRTQPEFERIGLFVQNTFAAIVRETGDAIGAINQLAPSFDVLKKGVSDFGLTSTVAIDQLLGVFNTVNNDAFKPLFENIQASGQLLKGLFDSNTITSDTFQAVAADIGQSIQEIVNRGGDMAQALALSAPQLQTLWEAQQRFGGVTDQTTQSILTQAEAQGVVGEQFRDVNERILDVLVAIGDALGATIPDALRAIPRAAQEAGTSISDSFNGAFDSVDGRIRTTGGEISDGLAARARAAGKEIQTAIGGPLDGLAAKAKSAASDVTANLAKIAAPDLTLTVDVDLSGFKPLNDVLDDDRFRNFRSVPALASGGVVTRPTLALVGERGPEAVIPLSRLGAAPPRQSVSATATVKIGDVHIHGNVDSDERARQVVRDFAKVVQQGGQLRTLARETLGVD